MKQIMEVRMRIKLRQIRADILKKHWLWIVLIFLLLFSIQSFGLDLYNGIYKPLYHSVYVSYEPTTIPIPSSCGVGYTQLKGSDGNTILDSTGGNICCPN